VFAGALQRVRPVVAGWGRGGMEKQGSRLCMVLSHVTLAIGQDQSSSISVKIPATTPKGKPQSESSYRLADFE
jgi:hypothetical protein